MEAAAQDGSLDEFHTLYPPVPEPPSRPRRHDQEAVARARMWRNRADYHNGRARRAGVRGTVSATQLRQIVRRDGSKCVYCERPLDYEIAGLNGKQDASFDHVISLSEGGPHSMENIVCSCRGCNESKNNHAEKVRAGKRLPCPTRFDKVLLAG